MRNFSSSWRRPTMGWLAFSFFHYKIWLFLHSRLFRRIWLNPISWPKLLRHSNITVRWYSGTFAVVNIWCLQLTRLMILQWKIGFGSGQTEWKRQEIATSIASIKRIARPRENKCGFIQNCCILLQKGISNDSNSNKWSFLLLNCCQ
jgi:hypothetical protein